MASWYLPAFAEQSIQTGFGTTRIDNTTVRPGSRGSTDIIAFPRDTGSTRIVFDTTVIETAVAQAVEAGREDAEVRTSTTLDRQLLGVVGQVVETRTVLRQDVGNVRTDVGSVAGSVRRVQGEVGTVNEAVRQVQKELRDTTITGGAGS